MAEEKVFSIDDLRLLILSFALDKKVVQTQEETTCITSIYNYFDNIIFQLLVCCFIPRFSFYFPR